MEAHRMIALLGKTLLWSAGLVTAAYWFWRAVWFYRNPQRKPPPGDNIVSPADGTVVYVKKVPPQEAVIAIKKGVKASIADIVREDLNRHKHTPPPRARICTWIPCTSEPC